MNKEFEQSFGQLKKFVDMASEVPTYVNRVYFAVERADGETTTWTGACNTDPKHIFNEIKYKKNWIGGKVIEIKLYLSNGTDEFVVNVDIADSTYYQTSLGMQFDLAAKLRQIENDTWPDTEEIKAVKAHVGKLQIALRMVQLNVADDVCWLLNETIRQYNEKGSEFSLRDAASLQVKKDELFFKPE